MPRPTQGSSTPRSGHASTLQSVQGLEQEAGNRCSGSGSASSDSPDKPLRARGAESIPSKWDQMQADLEEHIFDFAPASLLRHDSQLTKAKPSKKRQARRATARAAVPAIFVSESEASKPSSWRHEEKRQQRDQGDAPPLPSSSSHPPKPPAVDLVVTHFEPVVDATEPEALSTSSRTTRSSASRDSRRSGATQAEVDEMYAITFLRSKDALRQALHLLQGVWEEKASKLPRGEAIALRSALRSSRTLRESMAVARDTTLSSPKTGLEIAILWERCRTRALIASALASGDVDLLGEALKFAAQLGLEVSCENDLHMELQDRALYPRLSRKRFVAGDTDGSEMDVEETADMGMNEVVEAAQAVELEARQLLEQAGEPSHGWWSRWLHAWSRHPDVKEMSVEEQQLEEQLRRLEILKAQTTRAELTNTHDGDRAPLQNVLLLRAMRDHLTLHHEEGTAIPGAHAAPTVPQGLALDLGFLVDVTEADNGGRVVRGRGPGRDGRGRRGRGRVELSPPSGRGISLMSPLSHADLTL